MNSLENAPTDQLIAHPSPKDVLNTIVPQAQENVRLSINRLVLLVTVLGAIGPLGLVALSPVEMVPSQELDPKTKLL